MRMTHIVSSTFACSCEICKKCITEHKQINAVCETEMKKENIIKFTISFINLFYGKYWWQGFVIKRSLIIVVVIEAAAVVEATSLENLTGLRWLKPSSTSTVTHFTTFSTFNAEWPLSTIFPISTCFHQGMFRIMRFLKTSSSVSGSDSASSTIIWPTVP